MKDKVDIVIEGKKHAGTYSCDSGRHIICYEAAVDEEGSTVSYEIALEENLLTISQSGAIEAVMTYIQDGQEHECVYRTAYGDIPLRIYTHRLLVEHTDDSMNIEICYRISQNTASDSQASDNTIHIDIKSATA